MDRPFVSILTVNYNGRDYLPALLESLHALDYPADRREILLVDNASSDGSAAYVREAWPDVQLIEAPRNLGFAAANNLAYQKAKGEWIALINNDARADPHWLSELVAVTERHPRVGAVTGKIVFLDRPDVINSTGLVLFRNGAGGDRGFREPDDGRWESEEEVFGGCGASVLLRREMLDDIGFFDGSYFLYYEDLDLAWRAQLRGWTCRYTPRSVLHHVHCGTVGEGTPVFASHNDRNRVFTNLKNGRWGPVLRSSGGMAKRTVRALLGGSDGSRSGARFGAYVKAWLSLAWHLPRLLVLRMRNRVLRRRVSDRALARFVVEPPGAMRHRTRDVWRDLRNELRNRIEGGLLRRVRERIKGILRRAYNRTRLMLGGAWYGLIQLYRPDHRIVRELSRSKPKREGQPVDVIVCIHNALPDVQACLSSVLEHTQYQPFALILVDDGSDAPTRDFTAAFAEEHGTRHLRNETALGYTGAANQGLRASEAPVRVLLNSDTRVTPGWLTRIVQCLDSDPLIGIVGPLSNAATWQSVPTLSDPAGGWGSNPLPEGVTPVDMAALVDAESRHAHPRVPLVNGFCLAVRQEVLDAVGFLDERAFPQGYGEENDFGFRAARAGFSLAIADDAFVYHAKSRSFTHDRRAVLSEKGAQTLERLYGRLAIDVAAERLKKQPVLRDLRTRLTRRLIENGTPPPRPGAELGRILFLLPVPGGSGGAHSVVQETLGMRELGVDARVAILAEHEERYHSSYRGLRRQWHDVFVPYRSEAELLDAAAGCEIVVATAYPTVWLAEKIVRAHPAVQAAYYVQDYEPFFFADGSEEAARARESYSLIDGALLFAKTDWLRKTVRERHGLEVHKVCPSLDHGVYWAYRKERPSLRPIRVSAMIRPRTPRRSAALTMETLRKLQRTHGTNVKITVFGSTWRDIAEHALPNDFAYDNRGFLTREGVADVLRDSHVFVDYSTYQAFGRTGLEAMACGAAVILPAAGGADEFAEHRTNAMMVDTADAQACYETLDELVSDAGLRGFLKVGGLETARRYSIRKAALSEIQVFETARPTTH